MLFRIPNVVCILICTNRKSYETQVKQPRVNHHLPTGSLKFRGSSLILVSAVDTVEKQVLNTQCPPRKSFSHYYHCQSWLWMVKPRCLTCLEHWPNLVTNFIHLSILEVEVSWDEFYWMSVMFSFSWHINSLFIITALRADTLKSPGKLRYGLVKAMRSRFSASRRQGIEEDTQH